MLEQDVKNQIRETLIQELGREPMDEEVDAMMQGWETAPEEERREITIGLYRRFSNKNLQNAIQKKGLTYKDIKEKTGLHLQIISKIVNFKQKPTEKQKVEFAVLLKVPIDEIFPEKYDELFDRISPLPVKAETTIKMMSLDSPEVLKLQAPDNYFRNAEYKLEFATRLKGVMKHLTPREKAILEMRFGFMDGVAHTLDETAKEFSVTVERVRQIQAKALEKIRHCIIK